MPRLSSHLVLRVSVNIKLKLLILFMAIMSHSKEVRQATRAAGPCCHSDVLIASAMDCCSGIRL